MGRGLFPSLWVAFSVSAGIGGVVVFAVLLWLYVFSNYKEAVQ